MDTVQRTLTKKLIQNQLSHLLLIQGNGNDSQEMLNWSSEIINEYFFNIDQKKRSIQNNADVLLISDEVYLQKKFYDKKLVDDILHFLSHNPLIGNKKFIIIENLKYLSEIHMNKLLKTFEEPPIGLSLFLLNPEGAKPIQTVLSRSVTIHYPNKPQASDQDFSGIDKLKNLPLHKFVEKLKKDHAQEDLCAQYILNNATQANNNNLIEEINHYLKTRTHDEEYNYSANERIIHLYQCLELLNQ
tara:strand:+ start:7291 stop:8022 length:732 start_codon:yes stop_codon:yes gene_type:complete